VKALAWAAVVPVILISIFPVSAARYSLPAAVPLCWLMAMVFTGDAFIPLPRVARKGATSWSGLAQFIAGSVALAALITFPVLACLPNKQQKVRSVAEKVNAVVPATETLYAINPGYQPFLFYIRARVKYLDRVADLPSSAHYFFVRKQGEEEVMRKEHGPKPTLLTRVTDYREETIAVFTIGGA
jgi:hypothetical protein